MPAQRESIRFSVRSVLTRDEGPTGAFCSCGIYAEPYTFPLGCVELMLTGGFQAESRCECATVEPWGWVGCVFAVDSARKEEPSGLFVLRRT